MTATEKKTGWKVLIEELKSSQKKYGGNYYDDAVRVKKLFTDEEFEKFVRSENTTCTVYVDDVMKSTLFTSAELLGMFERYPDREQWVNGNLRGMREEMMRSLTRRDAGGEKNEDNSDRRLSWKEKYLALEAKYNELNAAFKQLKKDHAELQKSVSGIKRA